MNRIEQFPTSHADGWFVVVLVRELQTDSFLQLFFLLFEAFFPLAELASSVV